MAGNRDLILAGVSGGGTGSSLSWFAPKGTTMPTATTTALNAAFKDGGWVTEDGLRRAVEEQVQQIRAYGSAQPVRTLKTSKETRFEIGFLESGVVPISLFHSLPLTGTGSLTVAPLTGGFDFVEGPARTQEYAAVFDIVDGLNMIRAVAPVVEVTNTREFDVKAGSPIAYGMTLTAYPGSDGTAVHWYYILDALITP